MKFAVMKFALGENSLYLHVLGQNLHKWKPHLLKLSDSGILNEWFITVKDQFETFLMSHLFLYKMNQFL